MTDWYLWDGESQRGPMDRRELDNRIQYHPTPNLVRIWRHGFSDWQKIECAFDVTRKGPLDPSTFERPLERTGSSKRQNFFAHHWRGEYPLDDAVLIDFGRLVVDQYRALQIQDKAACYRFALGQGDQDVIRLLPKELTERELELDARIISSNRTQYGLANNDKVWEKIIVRLNSRGYSAKDLQLLTGTTSVADHARYCDLVIVLYQEIANLPPVEAAALLREFFSQS